MNIETIFKRSHTKMPFKIKKITEAILKAMVSVNNGSLEEAEGIAKQVYSILLTKLNLI